MDDEDGAIRQIWDSRGYFVLPGSDITPIRYCLWVTGKLGRVSTRTVRHPPFKCVWPSLDANRDQILLRNPDIFWLC